MSWHESQNESVSEACPKDATRFCNLLNAEALHRKLLTKARTTKVDPVVPKQQTPRDIAEITIR